MRSARLAIIYVRVSTDDQVRGYSLRQQLEACRAWCEREGYEVLEEVEDAGHSAAYLERPGLDRVRDLVETGGVSVVVAQDADRITREPIHRALLDEEMDRSGTRLVALDDWGDDSHEGALLKYMKGWVSKGERLRIAQRTRRGLEKKVSEGKIVRGKKAPYGFAYAEDGNSLRISEPEMSVVRSIFRMVGSEGLTLGEVGRRLKRKGITSPRGGAWHRTTLRNMLQNDLYRPLTAEEAAEQVSGETARMLDPHGSYGLWSFNKRRQTVRRERGDDGQIRKRYHREMRPREEWGLVAVDLTDAKLSRAHADAARDRISDNARRAPSNQSQRFWELSGGVVRCAECGSVLSPHTVTRKTKKPPGRTLNFYYQCRQRYNSGERERDCTNTRSRDARALEEAIWGVVYDLVSNPKRLQRAYAREMERRIKRFRDDPEHEVSFLAASVEKLERQEEYLLDLAADTLMPKEKLRSKMGELAQQRNAAQKALREAQDRRESIERLRRELDMVWMRFEQIRCEELRHLVGEDRRSVYGGLRLRVEIDKQGNARITGVFDVDIVELVPVGDTGLYRSSRRDEPPKPYEGVVSLKNTRAAGS